MTWEDREADVNDRVTQGWKLNEPGAKVTTTLWPAETWREAKIRCAETCEYYAAVHLATWNPYRWYQAWRLARLARRLREATIEPDFRAMLDADTA